MSLMGTLAKVAIGVAVAKGVGGMLKKSGGGAAGRGGSYGGDHSPQGGLEDMMGDILGGRKSGPVGGEGSVLGGSGGLGDLMEELGRYAPDGGRNAGRQGGGLDDVIGGLGGGGQSGGGLGDLLGGGRGQAGGGLGDILGGLLGGLAGARSAGGNGGGGFGDLLNQSLGNRGEPDVEPTPNQNAAAALMLRAMIQAAKADGRIDANEQKKLLGNLGDVSAEERRFVEQEMAAPVDVDALARQVPRGLEAQVYTMSIMAIDLDSRDEAQYLHQLAGAMGLDKRQINHIHARLGVPSLYA